MAESGMRAGYLTVNEARIMQGYDSIPNGDVLLVPLNLIPTPVSGKVNIPAAPLPDEGKRNPAGVISNTQNVPSGGKFCTHGITNTSNSKGLDADQKRIHWEAYAKKTERQEEMFKRVFDDVFSNQSEYMSDYYSKHGELPVLNDDETAKRFEAAIELVYHDAFESAV